MYEENDTHKSGNEGGYFKNGYLQNGNFSCVNMENGHLIFEINVPWSL